MKPTQVRWTLEAAAREFGRSRTTVTNRISAAGIKPDSDGTYSTRQIVDAVFGSIQEAKLREANARAALAEARKNIIEKNWIPATEVDRVWCQYVADLKSKIESTTIPRSERDSILRDLAAIPIEAYFQTSATETNDERD